MPGTRSLRGVGLGIQEGGVHGDGYTGGIPWDGS